MYSFLYVALGKNGWSLWSLADPSFPTVSQQWSAPAARDFIWSGDKLYLMGFDRVGIYSAADPLNPALVSEIE